jgi:hypothetical protein
MRNSRHDQRGNSTDDVQTKLGTVPGTPQELHQKNGIYSNTRAMSPPWMSALTCSGHQEEIGIY